MFTYICTTSQRNVHCIKGPWQVETHGEITTTPTLSPDGTMLYVASAVHSNAKDGAFVPIYPPGTRNFVLFGIEVKTASVLWSYTFGSGELNTTPPAFI